MLKLYEINYDGVSEYVAGTKESQAIAWFEENIGGVRNIREVEWKAYASLQWSSLEEPYIGLAEG